MFLVESQSKRGRTHHDIATTLGDALERASWCLRCWLELDGCGVELAEQIRGLLLQSKTVEAMDLWNAQSDDHHIAVHEIEFTRKNCHRESLDAGDNSRLAVAVVFDGHPDYDLFVTQGEALAFVSLMLARLPAGKRVRRKVRRLLRDGKKVEALDTWNRGTTDPKIAIHQITLVKANCHHDQ